MDDFKAWLGAEQPRHSPRSPIAAAIGYALGQWDALTLPVDYLSDVLLRMQTHPASRIDDLLPHDWTPPRAEPSP